MKEEIKKFFKGEVEDDEETLLRYSRDASIFEVRPRLVLFPMDSADVQNLVKWVSENKDKYKDPNRNKDWENLSITARCAGTDMSGGSIGESLVLDFTRHMNKLVTFTPSLLQGEGRGEVNYSITVQPGMFYRDFEKITLEKGLILPCYTASKGLNAMGGMYGNNSAGERTLKYGKTEDYILEAKMVFSDGNEYTIKPLTEKELTKKITQSNLEGEIYRNIYNLINKNKEEIKQAQPKVHKNSAGYYIWNVFGSFPAKNFLETAPSESKGQGTHTFLKNSLQENFPIFDLNKLLVGSQGTLGLVTEITFKLVPDFKYSKLVVIFMKDLDPLGRLVEEILKLKPETLETYDDKTAKLAVRFFPDFFKNRGLVNILKLGWNFLPEFFMMLKGGFPKLILLAQFAGENEEEANKQCVLLKERIENFKLKVHITKSQTESEKYFNIRRESFSLLRNHTKNLHTAPFIDDIIIRPEFLPKFLPALNKILKEYDLIYTLAGHVGDGNFHIIPLMDFSHPDTPKIIMELSEKVYDLVARFRGSITAEHNDGIIRTPYLSKIYNEKIIAIFREIKRIFDSKNIFNPGKKVPLLGQGSAGQAPLDGQMGTKEYIFSHIAQEHKAEHKI